mmetsp:Transcript_6466/g.18503  ORF Transcript_6466/g.18503 Transcript_6466/m.18503 type:complete len:219 (+) Transcript_6466:410-1066(+)
MSETRSFSTLRRLASGSSDLPTMAPTATIPDSFTASFSSFMYFIATSSDSDFSGASTFLATSVEKIRRRAQAFPSRTSLESSSSSSSRTISRIASSVFSVPKILHAAPVTLAAASRTDSSEWRIKDVLASKADGILSGSFDFLPPFDSTTARASNVAVWTATTPTPSSPPLSLPKDPATSSLMSGSTRVDNGMRSPRAPIASIRTWREGSDRAFTNVV